MALLLEVGQCGNTRLNCMYIKWHERYIHVRDVIICVSLSLASSMTGGMVTRLEGYVSLLLGSLKSIQILIKGKNQNF